MRGLAQKGLFCQFAHDRNARRWSGTAPAGCGLAARTVDEDRGAAAKHPRQSDFQVLGDLCSPRRFLHPVDARFELSRSRSHVFASPFFRQLILWDRQRFLGPVGRTFAAVAPCG